MYCRCVYIDSYEDILPLNFIMGFYVTQVFYTDFRSSFSFIILFSSVKFLASPSISFFLLVETSVSLYYLEHYLRFQLYYFFSPFPSCIWWSGGLALVEAVLAPLLDRHNSHGPRLLPSRYSTNIIRRAMSLKSILVSQPKKQMPQKSIVLVPQLFGPTLVSQCLWSPDHGHRGVDSKGRAFCPQLTFVLYFL